MTTRLQEGFLKEYCQYLEKTNTPSTYALWAGLTTVSSVLGRRCFLQNGFRTVYPNLFTLLVGPASVGKSTALNLGVKLMNRMENPPYLLSEKMTPEALIHALEESPNIVSGDNISTNCVGSAFLSEYGTFVDKNSFQNGMTNLLTDLWDNKSRFEYRTRGRGTEVLRNVCLNMIAGVTPGYVKEVTPVAAIESGYATRLLFIWSNGDEVKRYPIEEVPAERLPLLVRDLNAISRLTGEFVMTPEATKFFHDEYTEWWGSSKFFDEDISRGLAGRRMHIFQKLGIIISASMRDSKKINRGDFVIAKKLLESMEHHLPYVLQKITGTETSDIHDEIISFIRKRKVMTQAQIIAKFMRKIDKRTLDAVIEALVESQVVRAEGDILNPTITYIRRK